MNSTTEKWENIAKEMLSEFGEQIKSGKVVKPVFREGVLENEPFQNALLFFHIKMECIIKIGLTYEIMELPSMNKFKIAIIW